MLQAVYLQYVWFQGSQISKHQHKNTFVRVYGKVNPQTEHLQVDVQAKAIHLEKYTVYSAEPDAMTSSRNAQRWVVPVVSHRLLHGSRQSESQ